jgi:hypothetical protein
MNTIKKRSNRRGRERTCHKPANEDNFIIRAQENLRGFRKRIVVLGAHARTVGTSCFNTHNIANARSVQQSLLQHLWLTGGAGEQVARLAAVAHYHVLIRGSTLRVNYDRVLCSVAEKQHNIRKEL